MCSDPVEAAATRIHQGDGTVADTELVLKAYAPFIDKYTAILAGKTVSNAGRYLLADENIRYLAYAFKRGGDVGGTLRWVVEQCARYGYDELRAEVVGTFLECLRKYGLLRHFHARLARNISQLVGNPMEILVAEVWQASADPAEVSAAPRRASAEEMFAARGIVLTKRERDLLALLAQRYNVSWAARQLGIRRQSVWRILQRLKRKSALCE